MLMLHAKVMVAWLLGSGLLFGASAEYFAASGISSDVIDTAQRGGNLGAQAILFLALVAVGAVVISLDRRREKARAEERAADVTRYNELLATLKKERDEWKEERIRKETKLTELLESSVRQSAETEAAIRELAGVIRGRRAPA